MNVGRLGEIAAMAAIALLVALGGKTLLVTLSENKLLGGVLLAGVVLVALGAVRRAYDPADPAARANVTKAAAYLCAAVLGWWAVLAPAKFAFGACIVAAEAALAFDIITTAARGLSTKGN